MAAFADGMIEAYLGPAELGGPGFSGEGWETRLDFLALVAKAATDDEIMRAYRRLHREGWVHSVEAWDEEGTRIEDELARVDASHAITVSAHTTLGTSPMTATIIGVGLCTGSEHAYYVPVAHRYMGCPPQLSTAVVLDAIRRDLPVSVDERALEDFLISSGLEDTVLTVPGPERVVHTTRRWLGDRSLGPFDFAGSHGAEALVDLAHELGPFELQLCEHAVPIVFDLGAVGEERRVHGGGDSEGGEACMLLLVSEKDFTC